MAHRAKKFLLPWNWKGIELLWNRTMCKELPRVCDGGIGVSIPRLSFCTAICKSESGDFKLKMWKKIKKNDPEMEYFLNSSSTQERIKDLARIMDCPVDRATELVKRDSQLGVKNHDALYKSIKLLLSYGFTAEDIISHPSVLHRAYPVLQRRLEMLDNFKRVPSQRSMHVLRKTDFHFKTFLRYCAEEDELLKRFSSIEHCVASLLDCPIDEARELKDKYNLESISVVLLKSKIDLYRRFEIPSSVIRKSFYTLVYLSNSVIESRLQVLFDNDLLEHPYVGITYITKKKNIFEKYVSLMRNKKNALEGCKDKTDYLVFRLKCSKKVAEELVNNSIINRMSATKLRKMVDLFLNEMEVSSDFVISNKHLMTYSYDRSYDRWTFISTSRFNTPRWIPRLLCMSDERFQEFMKAAN